GGGAGVASGATGEPPQARAPERQTATTDGTPLALRRRRLVLEPRSAEGTAISRLHPTAQRAQGCARSAGLTGRPPPRARRRGPRPGSRRARPRTSARWRGAADRPRRGGGRSAAGRRPDRARAGAAGPARTRYRAAVPATPPPPRTPDTR